MAQAQSKSASTTKAAKPTGPGPGAKFAINYVLGEYFDGGGFGPSGDFVGTVVDAGFQIDRKIGKEIRADQNLGYFLALYLQLKVDEKLDEKDPWDPEPTDGLFDMTLKMGPLSDFYSFDEWVQENGVWKAGPPAGIKAEKGVSPFDILDMLAKGFDGNKETAGKPNTTFSLIEWTGSNNDLTGREANADTRGRWFEVRDGAKGRINSKSGYAQFELESSAAIMAAFPDRMLIIPGKEGKGDKAGGADKYVFNFTALNPADGKPYGADYFIGLSGTFGFLSHKFSQRDGTEGTQKVFYVNRAEKWGDEVAADEMGDEEEVKETKPAATATKKTSPAATTATSRAAASNKATTAKPKPAPAKEASEEGSGDGAEDSEGYNEFQLQVIDTACAWLYKQDGHKATTVVANPAIVRLAFDEVADRRLAMAFMKTGIAAKGGVDGRIEFDEETQVYSLTAEEVADQELMAE